MNLSVNISVTGGLFKRKYVLDGVGYSLEQLNATQIHRIISAIDSEFNRIVGIGEINPIIADLESKAELEIFCSCEQCCLLRFVTSNHRQPYKNYNL